MSKKLPPWVFMLLFMIAMLYSPELYWWLRDGLVIGIDALKSNAPRVSVGR